MKHLYYLSLVLLFLNLKAHSQLITRYSPKIYFDYDQAGNQVLRCRFGCFKNNNKSEVKVASRVKEENIKDIFTYYPNPVNDELVLSWSNNNIKKVHVFDINGKLLIKYNVKSNSTKFKIPFTNYIQGVYIVKVVFDDENIKMFKIIKK